MDLASFHRLVVKASKNREFAKLFDFIAEDGTKFDAIYDHAARFQAYLAQDEDLPDNEDRKYLTLKNPVVSKVYQGLLDLQDILTTHVCASKAIKRLITPHVIGSKGTRWGHPIVVFSKRKIDNK